jgi:hypothetical protein
MSAYRKPEKPEEIKISEWKFDPFRVPREIIGFFLEFGGHLMDEFDALWGFVFFFAIPIFISLSLLISLFLFGGMSMWGFHVVGWYLFPFFWMYIHKSLHLDNPERYELFREWVKGNKNYSLKS